MELYSLNDTKEFLKKIRIVNGSNGEIISRDDQIGKHSNIQKIFIYCKDSQMIPNKTDKDSCNAIG